MKIISVPRSLKRTTSPSRRCSIQGRVEPAVEQLSRLANGGRALEFAIGTGRVALPLARRGVEVCGVDLSESMVRQLRRKPGGRELSVTIGDMASTLVEGTFSLVYLVFNTIGNLTTQDDQVACFANAAIHLEPGGCFVVEVGVRHFVACRLARDTSFFSQTASAGASTSTTPRSSALSPITSADKAPGYATWRSRSAMCGQRSST